MLGTCLLINSKHPMARNQTGFSSHCQEDKVAVNPAHKQVKNWPWGSGGVGSSLCSNSWHLYALRKEWGMETQTQRPEATDSEVCWEAGEALPPCTHGDTVYHRLSSRGSLWRHLQGVWPSGRQAKWRCVLSRASKWQLYTGTEKNNLCLK